MLSKAEIEKKIRKLKPLITSQYHVRKIGYFGSFTEGDANEDSDIDILVHFSKSPG